MVTIPSPLAPLHLPIIHSRQLEVWVKRDDLIHPLVMGNKWRKLKYNIEEAHKTGKRGIVTFGGAYSNHLLATAAACVNSHLESIGFVRGEELNADSNYTLRSAHQQGMNLIFVERKKYQDTKDNTNQIEELYPDYLIIPEGGTNELAIKGCEEIITELSVDYDLISCSMGTGGTMLGLLSGMKGKSHLEVFPALKGDWIPSFVENSLNEYEISYRNYHITNDYHFGGYARISEALISFINKFKSDTGIPLDPVYTGKMMFGMMDLIEKEYFPKGSRIIILHTGGLQGIIGYNEKQGKNVLL